MADQDELSQVLRDSRAADTKMVSSVADAESLIEQFRARRGDGAWPSLDRQQVGRRLRELVVNPRLFRQGALNLCGPATFLCMWTGRDPVGFARFATTLYERGQAAIGSMNVAPSEALRQQNYGEMLSRMQDDPSPQADWMTMGAIRNNDDALFVWTGDPNQGVPGITVPEDLTKWLQATGIYSQVSNQASWSRIAGWPHASNLLEYGGQDVAILINTNALASGAVRELRNGNSPSSDSDVTVQGKLADPDGGILTRQFPNHYAMLLNSPTTNYDPADADKGSVWLSLWSWGESLAYEVPARAFVDNYYGAVIATLP
jgi:hypothetical protein